MLVTFNYGNYKGTGDTNTWVTGNRCERGEIVGDITSDTAKKRLEKIEQSMLESKDLLEKRTELLFQDYPYKKIYELKKNITIGLPRAFDFWRTMPFWTTFFHSLGFNTVISRKSSQKLFESGLQYVPSDTVCFPAKLIHGHIGDLAQKKVDRIFMPQLFHLPPDNLEKGSNCTCPVLKTYPLIIRFSDDPERRYNIPFDAPVFHWFSNKDRDRQLCNYMEKTFGVPPSATRKAIKQGDKSLKAFLDEITDEAKKIIRDVEKQNKFAVVISGRHYQFDEFVNHKLSRYFTSLGIPVIPVDALPFLDKVELHKSRLDIIISNHAKLLAGAIIAAKHPALECVEIYNFGCGHDALYTDEVVRLMHDISKKSPLILKLDESDVSGPLRIRIRSFIETVQIRRAHEKFQSKNVEEGYKVKYLKKDKKQRTILIPNVTHAFAKIISAMLVHDGLKAVPLPLGGKEATVLGKKYVHNDTCFPAQIVIGEALSVLLSGKYKHDEVAVGVGKTPCDCRLVNYAAFTRKALDDAGFADVPMITTDFADKQNIHPGYHFTPITYAQMIFVLIIMDILDALRRRIRPYETEKGATDKIVEYYIDDISDAFAKKGIFAAYKKYKEAIKIICTIKYDRSTPKPLVFITGEYLLTFHSGSNYNIESYMEANNIEVELPRMYDVYRNLMIHHTVEERKRFKVKHSLYDTLYTFGADKYLDMIITFLEKVALQHPLYEPAIRIWEAAKLSSHIIDSSLQSGEGFLMAADIIHKAKEGVKSFAILQPWGCLPNHICGRGVIKKIKEEYPDIQVLALDYDPDTSFANIENRLQMLIINARAQRQPQGQT